MEYKRLIIAMIAEIKETDAVFLRQIYVLIRQRIEKSERNNKTSKEID